MKWILGTVFLVAMLVPAAASAADIASPCSPASASLYPAMGAPPAISVWHQKELLQANWSPPSCTGWSSAGDARLLVTLSGQFRFTGPRDELLERIGAISSLRDVRYWSDDDKAWRPLASDASALTSASPESRRGDFKAGELTAGAQLYYSEIDDAKRETIYHLTVYANSPDCIVLADENVTPIKRFMFTIFKPATLQSIIILQRLSTDTYGVYMLNKTDKSASSLSDGHDKEYVNRSIALYRKLAGIRTDLEPPLDERNDTANALPGAALRPVSASVTR